MKLYLSSDGLGATPKDLKDLAGEGQAAIVVNAVDWRAVEERSQRFEQEQAMLRELGYDGLELDLRKHSGAESIRQFLTDKKLVWVRGGNSFLLIQRMRQSGFDQAIKQLLDKDEITYGGYSAGAMVAGTSLRGFEHADDPSLASEVHWDGLGLIDYAVIPHWESGEWAEQTRRVKQVMDQHGVKHRVLRDGEVIIVR